MIFKERQAGFIIDWAVFYAAIAFLFSSLIVVGGYLFWVSGFSFNEFRNDYVDNQQVVDKSGSLEDSVNSLFVCVNGSDASGFSLDFKGELYRVFSEGEYYYHINESNSVFKKEMAGPEKKVYQEQCPDGLNPIVIFFENNGLGGHRESEYMTISAE